MIKGVIFDVDGVLLDSMFIWDDAAERFLASKGITAGPGLRDILFTMSVPESAEYLKKNYLPDMSEEEIIRGTVETVADFYVNEACLKPGVVGLLDAIKIMDIPMAVATSSDRSYLGPCFRRLGIDEYFAGMCTCTELQTSKRTSPLVYDTAAEILRGKKPDEKDRACFWIIEDAFHAISTAKQAGYRIGAVYDDSAKDERAVIEQTSDVYIGPDYGFEVLAEAIRKTL